VLPVGPLDVLPADLQRSAAGPDTAQRWRDRLAETVELAGPVPASAARTSAVRHG